MKVIVSTHPNGTIAITVPSPNRMKELMGRTPEALNALWPDQLSRKLDM